MTIFKHVFQRHMEQHDAHEPYEDEVDTQVHPADHFRLPEPPQDVPAPIQAEQAQSVPVQTISTQPVDAEAPLALHPADMSPRHGAEMPEPSEPLEVVHPPETEEMNPELAARAAEAQRLIEESQMLRQATTGAPAAALAEALPAGTATSEVAPAAPSRVRTRLLGFGAVDARSVDPLDELADSATQPQFPCGWLVVIKGPGRGASFALHPGVAQIGRGSDQAISLDFGDRAISRERHAVVAYDGEVGKFYLGHGGKSNIIRLNDRPVLSTEEMGHGDVISIGETVLRFAAFCDPSFNWGEGE